MLANSAWNARVYIWPADTHSLATVLWFLLRSIQKCQTVMRNIISLKIFMILFYHFALHVILSWNATFCCWDVPCCFLVWASNQRINNSEKLLLLSLEWWKAFLSVYSFELPWVTVFLSFVIFVIRSLFWTRWCVPLWSPTHVYALHFM